MLENCKHSFFDASCYREKFKGKLSIAPMECVKKGGEFDNQLQMVLKDGKRAENRATKKIPILNCTKKNETLVHRGRFVIMEVEQ